MTNAPVVTWVSAAIGTDRGVRSGGLAASVLFDGDVRGSRGPGWVSVGSLSHPPSRR